MRQERPLLMEKLLQMAWVGLKVGWGRVSGNHQGWVNSISKADGDSDMVLACVDRLSEKIMASARTFVWEKAAPPWCQTIQFLPICPWCLSSCYPSAGAQSKWVLSKFMCGPFKRNTWDSRSPVSLSHNLCWFLQPAVMGTPLPSTRTLGWVIWCGARTSRSLVGDLCSWDIPPDF